MTYTERYLLSSAFGIKENALDFDAHDNTKQKDVFMGQTELGKYEMDLKMAESITELTRISDELKRKSIKPADKNMLVGIYNEQLKKLSNPKN
jgi:hypothetical protein